MENFIFLSDSFTAEKITSVHAARQQNVSRDLFACKNYVIIICLWEQILVLCTETTYNLLAEIPRYFEIFVDELFKKQHQLAAEFCVMLSLFYV